MSGVLGLIPARGGSKGIPGKNLRLLGGRPLFEWAAISGRDSGVIDRLVLSTDSEEIAAAGLRAGVEVPFLRPSDLARDETPTLPVMQHAVSYLEREGWHPDVVVLLQPTAPLRRPEHVRRAVMLQRETGCDSVVSVVEVPRHYLPHFVLRIVDGRLDHFIPEGRTITRRQDAPMAYSRDGTVYVTRRDVLMLGNSIYGADCRPLLLAHDESVNLDSLEDWRAAEIAMERLRPASSGRAT